MKTTPFFLFIVLFPLLFSFTACQKQGTEWEGTIEEEDGVIVVKNPKEPIYKREVFNLEEELSIGEAEGREEYMFSQIFGIAIDEEERIYVVDYDEANVKIFDATGEHIKTFGEQGQGPGELIKPSTISITYKGEIMLEDSMPTRINFFTLDGEFIKSFPSKDISYMPRSRMDSNGNIMRQAFFLMDENPRHEIMKLDSELNHIHTVVSIPFDFVMGKPINPFAPSLWWDITKDDQIIFGYSKDYELKIANSEGKVFKKITREYDPIEIDEETKKKFEEVYTKTMPQVKLTFPKYFPPFQHFFLDDEGRIYVRTFEKQENSELNYYEVFDEEGRYIAKLKPKAPLYVFKRGKMYTIVEDEEGYYVVKRYKVIWNTELK